MRDPKLGGSTLGAYSLWWTTIETPDKYTITLKSDLSRPTLFDSLQLFNMPALSLIQAQGRFKTMLKLAIALSIGFMTLMTLAASSKSWRKLRVVASHTTSSLARNTIRGNTVKRERQGRGKRKH